MLTWIIRSIGFNYSNPLHSVCIYFGIWYRETICGQLWLPTRSLDSFSFVSILLSPVMLPAMARKEQFFTCNPPSWSCKSVSLTLWWWGFVPVLWFSLALCRYMVQRWATPTLLPLLSNGKGYRPQRGIDFHHIHMPQCCWLHVAAGDIFHPQIAPELLLAWTSAGLNYLGHVCGYPFWLFLCYYHHINTEP